MDKVRILDLIEKFTKEEGDACDLATMTEGLLGYIDEQDKKIKALEIKAGERIKTSQELLAEQIEPQRVKAIFTMKTKVGLDMGLITFADIFVPENIDFYVELEDLSQKIGYLGGGNGNDKENN